MKRVIVDYRKVPKDVLKVLTEKYPDGYDHEDTVSFKNSNGEWIRALEIVINDTVYLVKVNAQSSNNTLKDIDIKDIGAEKNV